MTEAERGAAEAVVKKSSGPIERVDVAEDSWKEEEGHQCRRSWGVWLRPRAPLGRAESTRTKGPWRPHVGSHQCGNMRDERRWKSTIY